LSSARVENGSEFPVRPVGPGLVSRQLVDLSVTISGQDLHGIAFAEECHTRAIAENGVVVITSRSLAADQEVFIQHDSRGRLARVIGQCNGDNYELCFTENDPSFWDISSTRDNVANELLPDDPTTDPPTATDPLLVANYDEFSDSMPPKPPPRTSERRRTPRITLRQAKACVVFPGTNPDIVELINISRGGLCFRSHRVYPVGGIICVAAPYTHGSTNVFVSGRIRRIVRDTWGGLYGVEYIG
jgi:hypothetical protein